MMWLHLGTHPWKEKFSISPWRKTIHQLPSSPYALLQQCLVTHSLALLIGQPSQRVCPHPALPFATSYVPAPARSTVPRPFPSRYQLRKLNLILYSYDFYLCKIISFRNLFRLCWLSSVFAACKPRPFPFYDQSTTPINFSSKNYTMNQNPLFRLIDNCFVDYCPHWSSQWVIIRQ